MLIVDPVDFVRVGAIVTLMERGDAPFNANIRLGD